MDYMIANSNTKLLESFCIRRGRNHVAFRSLISHTPMIFRSNDIFCYFQVSKMSYACIRKCIENVYTCIVSENPNLYLMPKMQIQTLKGAL